jgi:hypothetical protein
VVVRVDEARDDDVTLGADLVRLRVPALELLVGADRRDPTRAARGRMASEERTRAHRGGEREALKSQLTEAFAPFVADGGYELPGVALCAIAS